MARVLCLMSARLDSLARSLLLGRRPRCLTQRWGGLVVDLDSVGLSCRDLSGEFSSAAAITAWRCRSGTRLATSTASRAASTAFRPPPREDCLASPDPVLSAS
jgi:hypothetical protein